MPLTKLQADILKVLASQRDPESYVAGAAPLNRSGPRYSDDIDVFHDREERVALAALADGQSLEAAGFEVAWLGRLPLIYGSRKFAETSTALDEAEAFVTRMPTSKMGLLFLEAGEVIQPDPDRLVTYETHSGQRRGHWPTNPEIAAAMLARWTKP